ncbi:ABC-three component system protein [Novosphingobium pokkalii]|uniref:ABC-three component system protein n=1 Tax=Novosphingobium pokkalii TaxID=1770194 RepID=A0ABV7V6N3_9SPHN|nr:ABC-three component system protein [Novosphingobium pokkalii]
MTGTGPTPVFPTGLQNGVSAPTFDVVFIHGLSGDRFRTWTAKDGAFWPQWLADEFDNINVYLAGYDSAAFAGILLGSGASIQDLATTLADGLISRPRQAENTVLITHSLGGLIVKQMLRRCADSADVRFNNLAQKVRAVVFLGTPHQGAQLATALDLILRPFKSKASQQLAYGGAELLDLSNFFSNFAVRENVIVRPFYETETTGGIHIVDRVTANPNVYGAEPIAVQANHIDICKPETTQALVYLSVCELLRTLPSSGSSLVVAGAAANLTSSSAGQSLLPVPLCTTIQSLPPVGVEIALPPATDIPSPQGVASDIMEDFAYFTTVAADDRRSLDQKLREAGRAYQIKDATRRKERFAMALRRHIAQPSAVTRYTQLLGDVESRFARHVRRPISEGATLAQVDHAIQSDVLDPCVRQFSSPGSEITSALVDNALYYLAGNCHVSWDA